jgi:hypothetical protein
MRMTSCMAGYSHISVRGLCRSVSVRCSAPTARGWSNWANAGCEVLPKQPRHRWGSSRTGRSVPPGLLSGSPWPDATGGAAFALSAGWAAGDRGRDSYFRSGPAPFTPPRLRESLSVALTRPVDTVIHLPACQRSTLLSRWPRMPAAPTIGARARTGISSSTL